MRGSSARRRLRRLGALRQHLRETALASAELVRLWWAVIPRRWWRKSPYLPLPPGEYLEWRLQTAYGPNRPGLRVLLRDLRGFLLWRRRMRRRS